MEIGKWLSEKLGRGERHPLATASGIAEFLSTLPDSNPAVALSVALDAIDAAAGAKLAPGEFRGALRAIDDGLQPHIATLWHMLLRDSRGDQISEAALGALNLYCQRLEGLLQRQLELAPAAGARDEAQLADAGTFARRVLHALGRRKLLLRLSYRPVDADYWAAVSAAYGRVGRLGLQRAEGEAWPGGGRTSPSRELAALLLFDVAPIGNLTPVQMIALDALLHRIAAQAVIANDPGETVPFAFDTAKPQPPTRWLPGLKPKPTQVFVGPGAGLALVQNLELASRQATDVPEWAHPSGVDLEAYRRLLGAVLLAWGPQPAQRRHRRESHAAELMVVYGFVQARRMVAASEFARSAGELGFAGFAGDRMRDDRYFNKIRFGSVNPDKTTTGRLSRQALTDPAKLLEKLELEGDRLLMQRWKVADASESGLGASAKSIPSWARLGVLIGTREQDSLEWRLGIVRRLGRDAEGMASIGIERLAGAAASARALPIPGVEPGHWEHIAAGGEGTLDALHVHGRIEQLALPPGRYEEAQALLVWAARERFPARIAKLLDAGRDFQLVLIERAA